MPDIDQKKKRKVIILNEEKKILKGAGIKGGLSVRLWIRSRSAILRLIMEKVRSIGSNAKITCKSDFLV